MIFPAVAELAEELGLDLLDRGVVVLLGLPRSGRTTVVQRVADLLGASAMHVRGRSIRSADYRNALDAIEADLATRLNVAGHAELLIDDFGVLMRQTFGHAFQSALRALTVDGAFAGRVGVLLTATLSDPLLAPKRHGSPLVAHARVRFMPWLTSRDHAVGAIDENEQRLRAELCGSNAALLDRAQDGAAGARAFAVMQLPRWLADLSQEDLTVLISASERPLTYDPAHDRVAPLLTRNGTTVRLITAVPTEQIREAQVGPWPAALPQAAARLAVRIGAEPSPLWIDRYLGTHTAELAKLIRELAPRVSPRELRLLASTDGIRNTRADPLPLRGAIAAALTAGLQVNWRILGGQDFAAAHARWLVLPSTGTVYLLPPEDRVLGVNTLGNEGDALATRDFAIGEGFWARSHSFVP